MTQPYDQDPSQEQGIKSPSTHAETLKRLEHIAKEVGPEAVSDYVRTLLEDDSPETEAERTVVRRSLCDYMYKDFVQEATLEGEELSSQLQNGTRDAYSIASSGYTPQPPELVRLGDTLQRVAALESRSAALAGDTMKQQVSQSMLKNGQEPIPDIVIKKFAELFEEGSDEARQQFASQEVDWTRLDQIVESLKPLGESFALLRYFARVLEEAPRHPQETAAEMPRVHQTILDLRNHLATTL